MTIENHSRVFVAVIALFVAASMFAGELSTQASSRVTVIIPEIHGFDVPPRSQSASSNRVDSPRRAAVEVRLFNSSAGGELVVRKIAAEEHDGIMLAASRSPEPRDQAVSLGNISHSWTTIEDRISVSSVLRASSAATPRTEVVYELWQF